METLKDLKHVMIDTETLGLTPGCVVRTVSLVEFEPTTGKTGRKQTWVINLQDSIKAGFKVEAGTIKWWMTKSDEARKAFVATPEEETSLVSFVNEFVEWFKQYNGKVAVWGLQIDYDLPMVRCYLAYYYMYIMRNDDYPLPWNRKLLIDVRPFMEVYRAKHEEYKTVHTSMDDCMQQIEAVAEVFKSFKQVNIPNEENLTDFILKMDICRVTMGGVDLIVKNT